MKSTVSLVILAFLFVTGADAADGVFKVGFAQVDVTPPAPMPMWGYGDRHAALSTGVHDPLLAKAVVIDAGTDKLAIVGLDLGRSPVTETMDNIMERVKADAGVNHVLMSGSHTHHGPVLELADEEGKGKGVFDEGVAYIESLEDTLVGLIVDAAKNVQDARIGWGTANIDMNRNRHTDFEPKPRDTELNVIRFDDANGELLTLVVNFAAHPTMIPSSNLEYSADYPGQMMKAVEAETGAHCVFMQGAAGDMSTKTTEETQGIEKFGKALAQEVLNLAETIETKVPENPTIESWMKTYSLPQRIDLTNPMIGKMFETAFFPELAKAAMVEYADGKIRPRMTVVLLNNELALVGGSGEFFSSHANRLKERSRIETFFFGYCNGHNMYFPTIEGAAEGGYGGDPMVSWVPVGTGELLINDALTAIYDMLDKYKSPMEQPARIPVDGDE